MRILVFSTDDHLYPAGGAEQAFGNIAERLPHITFDLVCARLRKSAAKYEHINNVHIHRIGFGIPKVDGILLALYGHVFTYRLMKKYSYDLIWSIMASYGAFPAVRIKKKTGLPFLLTLQEGDSFDYIYKKVRFVKKSFADIFSYADGIQAISNYLLAWGKQMGYSGENGLVIPNGVNIEAYTRQFTASEVAATRSSFGFSDDSLILFSTSRLEKKNGHRDIITALTYLPDNVCFINWHVGALRGELEELVRSLNLEKRVLLAPAVKPEDLPLLVQACDIFIRPSLSEGLGNSFLEAMASRKLIIGTPVGGIPDFLTDGVTGFMVEVENPVSIADVVQKIVRLTDEDRDKILNHAERMVRAKYDWNLIAQEMEGLFNTLVV